MERHGWEVVELFFVLVFEVLDRVRAPAQFAWQHDDPATVDATYITYSLMVHHEMQVFMDTGFLEHPEFNPKVVRHMFENSVSRVHMERVEDGLRVVKGLADKTAKDLEQQSRSIKGAHEKADLAMKECKKAGKKS